MAWWSRTYNRPLKDPLLLSYTFEELLYEYYDKIIKENQINDLILGSRNDDDDIDDEELEESINWIKEQERIERENANKDNNLDEPEIGDDLIIDDFEE